MLVFALFALITSIACYFMVSMPSFTVVMAIIWGASLIVGGLYIAQRAMLVLYIINILLLYGLAGGSALFFYLTFFGLAAFVMSFMAGSQRDYYKLQRAGILIAVLGVSFFIGVVYFSSGGAGIAMMEDEVNNYLTGFMKEYEDSGMVEFYERQGITKAELEAKISDFGSTLAKHLPAFYYLQALFAVFFMLLSASYMSMKGSVKQMPKRPFDQEIMPWQFTWLVILGLALWLWGKEYVSPIIYVGSNILIVLVPITVYFGLSTAVFKLKRQKPGGRKWMITVLLVLAVVFPLSVILFLSLLGLFDSLFDYRKLGEE